MKTLKMIKYVFDRILLVTSLTILTIMVLVIIYQVFSRQLLGTTPAWTEALSRLLFVWVGFLGIAYGFKEKLHIGVGLVVNLFPKKIQHVFDYFAKVLIIGFGVIMIYYGWQFTQLMSGSTIAGLGLTSSYLYAAIPVTGFFVTVYGIELLFIKGLHQNYDDVSEG